MDHEVFDGIVAGFYRAAGGTLTWTEALQPVQQALAAYLVILYAVDLSRKSVVFSYEVGEAPPESHLDYIRHYHRMDPRGGMALGLAPGQWFNCHEHFDEDFVANDPFYQEFLLPYKSRYVSGTKLLQDGSFHAILGIQRGVGRSPLNTDELALCQRLGRHLTEALKLHRANLPLRQAGVLGVELIARLRAPLALIDDQRQLLHMNASASALLANSTTLVASEGHLHCRHPREDSALLVALRDLQLAGDPQAHIGSADKAYLRIGVGSGEKAMGLFLYALRPDSTLHAFGERSLAMVLFNEAGARIELDPFVVAAAFELTPGEARVAVAIAEGLSVEAAAARHAVSTNTVRSQLRSVFAKTGISRQAELVRLLASMPIVALRL